MQNYLPWDMARANFVPPPKSQYGDDIQVRLTLTGTSTTEHAFKWYKVWKISDLKEFNTAIQTDPSCSVINVLEKDTQL